MNDLPIGIFDSGLGGLTVVREVLRRLPEESVVYFGDTARVPYGTKSAAVVQKFSLQIMNFLLERKVKMIVVACNTASSFAAGLLKKEAAVPVMEMIDPGARAALRSTATGRIGIIGTEGTVRSGAYEDAIKSYDPGAKVFSKACPLFVPIVEEGWIDGSHGKIVAQIAREYLSPLKKNRIDALILGCTHYPLIKEAIAKEMGRGVTLVDSASAAAMEIKTLLYKSGLKSRGARKPSYGFYVSDAPEKCTKIAAKILGRRIPPARKIDIEKYGVRS
jgi:glutamate racemase